MSQKIHLISYGNDKFKNSKQRIYNEAINSKWFDSVNVYGPEILDASFKSKFEHVLKQPRGGGYWIWKSYIIKKKLDEINDNDILIYIDAGCTINTKGKQRFDEYINMLNSSDEGIISFQMPHIEKHYTTKEVFDYFNVGLDSKIANSGQIIGGIRIMKKNNKLINKIALESKTLYDNPLLFTDNYNNKQAKFFIDHRHEQSIMSVIRKMGNPILLKDETWFNPFGNEESLKYPFWATRKRN